MHLHCAPNSGQSCTQKHQQFTLSLKNWSFQTQKIARLVIELQERTFFPLPFGHRKTTYPVIWLKKTDFSFANRAQKNCAPVFWNERMTVLWPNTQKKYTPWGWPPNSGHSPHRKLTQLWLLKSYTKKKATFFYGQSSTVKCDWAWGKKQTFLSHKKGT